MTPVTVRTIDVETPGDVAVRYDGAVAIADMTGGKVIVVPPDMDGREHSAIDNLPDVRSVFWSRDTLCAACTFPRRVEYIESSKQRTGVVDLGLPAWITDTPSGDLLVAEISERRLQRLSGDIDPVRTSIALPAVNHFTCFCYDNHGTLWYPNRPFPEVVEFQTNLGILRRHQFNNSKRSEFTGICRDLASDRAMLVLDRDKSCLWRLESGRYTLATKLPRRYKRLRALRSHGSGRYAYSVIDPPTSTILWLNKTLAISEIWRGCAQDRRTVVRAPMGDGGVYVEVVDNLGELLLQPVGATAAMPLWGQPRDLRMLDDGGILLVLRDAHSVVWMDSHFKHRVSYGGAKQLLYPCSADVNPRRQTVVVVDPLRAQLVEFTKDGYVHGTVPTPSTYVRWVRCCSDGSTWIIDVAKQNVLLFGPNWDLWKTMVAPSDLDLSDINRAESSPTGALLVRGPRIGEWAISPEGIIPLDNMDVAIRRGQ